MTNILDIKTTQDFLQVCVQIMDIQDLLNIYLTHIMSTWTHNLAAMKYNQNMDSNVPTCYQHLRSLHIL